MRRTAIGRLLLSRRDNFEFDEEPRMVLAVGPAAGFAVSRKRRRLLAQRVHAGQQAVRAAAELAGADVTQRSPELCKLADQLVVAHVAPLQ
jgi:hypothetical protein